MRAAHTQLLSDIDAMGAELNKIDGVVPWEKNDQDFLLKDIMRRETSDSIQHVSAQAFSPTPPSAHARTRVGTCVRTPSPLAASTPRRTEGDIRPGCTGSHVELSIQEIE